MAKKKKSNKTTYSVGNTETILPSEGLHDARIIGFVELGTQKTDWGDKFQVEVAIELVDESAVFNEEDGEKNFVKYMRCTKSLGKRATLGKLVRKVHPEDIDELEEVEMDDILNQPLRVEIEYSEDEQYANIVGFFKVKEKDADKIDEAENEAYSLYLDENFDQDVFDTLPDWKQEMIAESPEGEELIEDGTLEFGSKPKSKKGKKTTKKKKGEDEEDDEDYKPKSKRGKKSRDDEEEDEEEDEQEETDEDEEDEKPKRRGSRRKQDDDDEEDDKPKSRRGKQGAKTGRRQTGKSRR